MWGTQKWHDFLCLDRSQWRFDGVKKITENNQGGKTTSVTLTVPESLEDQRGLERWQPWTNSASQTCPKCCMFMIKALWQTLRKTEKLPAAIGRYPEGSSCLSTILKAKINYSVQPVPSPPSWCSLEQRVTELQGMRPDFKLQNTKGTSFITSNILQKPS